METLWQDVRYGARSLLKTPGPTAIIILMLVAGTGLNASVFSVVHAALFRPLPYEDAERLVTVREVHPERPASGVAPGNLLDWQDSSRFFEGVGGFVSTPVELSGSDQPERIHVQIVLEGTLELLGVSPLIGRSFQPADYEITRSPWNEISTVGNVALLSHGFWQRRFGADPQVIGKTIRFWDTSCTIVGVLPPQLRTVWKGIEVHVPWILLPEGREERRFHNMPVIARLRTGVSLEKAQLEMSAIYRQLQQQHTENREWDVRLVPLREQLLGKAKWALLVLLAGAGVVLLIACGNVANLLLARSAARDREFALRRALGAGSARIFRQLLTESLLLAGTSVALSIPVALSAIAFLDELTLRSAPFFDLEPKLDLPVFVFTLAISVLGGLLFGLFPALRASRFDLSESIKGGRTTRSGSLKLTASAPLVVAQVTLAVVLLVVGGLLLKSFWHLNRIELGFAPERLLTLELSGEEHHRFSEQVLAEIRSIPGVLGVDFTSALPLRKNRGNVTFVIEGRSSPRDKFSATVYTVSTDYFRTMGIRLLQGRTFSRFDTRAVPWVVVINETMAREYWPNVPALGQRIRLFNDMEWSPVPGESNWATVVGVVSNVRQADPTEPPERAFYIHRAQRVLGPRSFLAVRTAVDPLDILPAAKERIRSLNPTLLLTNVQTMDGIVKKSLEEPRFRTGLVGLYAVLALVLAAAGLYGLLVYSVTRRTKEIGIRMAIGAQHQHILRLVIGQGMKLTLLGTASGAVLAIGASRFIASLLFDVSPNDPLTFASVTALLLAVAFLASYLPARSATKVDPIVVLRYE